MNFSKPTPTPPPAPTPTAPAGEVSTTLTSAQIRALSTPEIDAARKLVRSKPTSWLLQILTPHGVQAIFTETVPGCDKDPKLLAGVLAMAVALAIEDEIDRRIPVPKGSK